MEKFKNAVAQVGEFALILVYIAAAIGEVTSSEPITQGVLGWLFSNHQITWVYAVWFIVMALALLASKIFKKRKLHKYALAAMYLTTVYTISLSLALFGLEGAAIIDDGIIGAVAAACWLRWKFKTEYINPKQFSKDLHDLR